MCRGVVRKFYDELGDAIRIVQNVLKFDHSLLAKFDFPISRRYNALHGLSGLASILAAAALHRSCSHQASRLVGIEAAMQVGVERIDELDTPTSLWARELINSNPDPDAMEERWAPVDDAAVAALREAGIIPARPIGSIDGHKMEYYGEYLGDDYTVRSKYKNGTSTFVVAVSSAIVSGPYTIHTSSRILRRGRPLSEYVGDLLDDNARRLIFCLYYSADREYYNVNAMNKFGNRGEYFLMYARMTPKVKKAMAEYERGERPALSEHIVKSKKSKFAGTLAFWEVEEFRDGELKKTTLPFFSNMPRPMLRRALPMLRAEMRKRQRIENGYREAEQGMPMTTSNSPALRTFLFHYSLLSSNLWVLADRTLKALKLAKKGESIQDVQTPRLGTHGWKDKEKYAITYKEFCRILLGEATRLAILGKTEQDAYEAEAREEFSRLFTPDAATAALLARKRAKARVAAGPLFAL